MPITKINSYDPDEVFKQKCNENFSDINARVVSYSGFAGSFDDVYPIGSVICIKDWHQDDRFKIGTWRLLGSIVVDTTYTEQHSIQFYERIA